MGLERLKARLRFAYRCFKDFDKIKSVVLSSEWETESPSGLEYALSQVKIRYFNRYCTDLEGSPKIFGRSPF
jgi:hypothetical protein